MARDASAALVRERRPGAGYTEYVVTNRARTFGVSTALRRLAAEGEHGLFAELEAWFRDHEPKGD